MQNAVRYKARSEDEGGGIGRLVALAQAEDREAMFCLGLLNLMGHRVPRSPERALEWFQQVVELGDPESGFEEGNSPSRQISQQLIAEVVMMDPAVQRFCRRGLIDTAALAFRWYARHGVSDATRAHFGAATVMAYQDPPPCPRTWLEHLLRAADGNLTEAYLRVLALYQRLGAGEEEHRALQQYRDRALEGLFCLAHQGSPEAWLDLGVFLATGRDGGMIDRAAALDWLSLAAETGDETSQRLHQQLVSSGAIISPHVAEIDQLFCQDDQKLEVEETWLARR